MDLVLESLLILNFLTELIENGTDVDLVYLDFA